MTIADKVVYLMMSEHRLKLSATKRNSISEQKQKRCPLCDKISDYAHGNCRSCGHEIS